MQVESEKEKFKIKLGILGSSVSTTPEFWSVNFKQLDIMYNITTTSSPQHIKYLNNRSPVRERQSLCYLHIFANPHSNIAITFEPIMKNEKKTFKYSNWG